MLFRSEFVIHLKNPELVTKLTHRVDKRRNSKFFIYELLVQISLDEHHLFSVLIPLSVTLDTFGYFFLKLCHVSVYVSVNLYNFLATSLTPLLPLPVVIL